MNIRIERVPKRFFALRRWGKLIYIRIGRTCFVFDFRRDFVSDMTGGKVTKE